MAEERDTDFEVVVIGSANIDLEVSVPRWPQAGESVIANATQRFTGGKGANQAIASARAGGVSTALIGAVGDDLEGKLLRDELLAGGVDTRLVQTVDAPTGMAIVMLNETGANVITVVPGANSQLELTEHQRSALSGARVVLAQLEIPLETVRDAAAATTGVFILNAAPSRPVPIELFKAVNVLVVNRKEARAIAKQAFGLYPSDNRILLAALQRLVPSVVMTRGDKGCWVAEAGQEIEHVKALPTQPVDHTGGGDTFCGVLAARLASGATLTEATRTATAAASIALSRPGAGASIPTAQELAQALATRQIPPAASTANA
jgi:ribokinase